MLSSFTGYGNSLIAQNKLTPQYHLLSIIPFCQFSHLEQELVALISIWMPMQGHLISMLQFYPLHTQENFGSQGQRDESLWSV